MNSISKTCQSNLTSTIIHKDRELFLPDSVVTIGTFDGVHLGHQGLIRHVVQAGREMGVPSVVYTFNIPPKAFFSKKRVLTTVLEKVSRIAKLGVDHIVVAHFDQTYASQSADIFLRELRWLAPKKVWVGDDFRFGKNRTGDTALLGSSFNLGIFPEMKCDAGMRISSTRVRTLIETGQLSDAQTLIGW